MLQSLAFYVACKTTLLDEECSTLILEMLKTSKVLASLPCSAAHVMRIITQFSGQARKIAPADKMHEVAVVIHDQSPSPSAFRKMDCEVLAKLLTSLFDSMKDEASESVTLSGQYNSVWLVSTLLWLFQDEACLIINESLVKGDPKAKLCISIQGEPDNSWNLQVFRKSDDPTNFVFSMRTEKVVSLSQIPLHMFQSFVNHYYWCDFQSTEIRRKAILATGGIAQTLIVMMADCGRLYQKMRWLQREKAL